MAGIALGTLGAIGGGVSSAATGVGSLLGGGAAAGGGSAIAGATAAGNVPIAATAAATPTFLGLTGTQLTGLSIAGSLAAGGLGIMSSLNQSEALAEQQRHRARLNAASIAKDRRRRLGTLRAQLGTTGTQLSGTALDVLAENESQAEYDRLLALSGGDAVSRGTLARGRSQAIGAGLSGFSGAVQGGARLVQNQHFRNRFGG